MVGGFRLHRAIGGSLPVGRLLRRVIRSASIPRMIAPAVLQERCSRVNSRIASLRVSRWRYKSLAKANCIVLARSPGFGGSQTKPVFPGTMSSLNDATSHATTADSSNAASCDAATAKYHADAAFMPVFPHLTGRRSGPCERLRARDHSQVRRGRGGGPSAALLKRVRINIRSIAGACDSFEIITVGVHVLTA